MQRGRDRRVAKLRGLLRRCSRGNDSEKQSCRGRRRRFNGPVQRRLEAANRGHGRGPPASSSACPPAAHWVWPSHGSAARAGDGPTAPLPRVAHAQHPQSSPWLIQHDGGRRWLPYPGYPLVFVTTAVYLDPSLRRPTAYYVGLFPRTPSIFSMTSGVSLGSSLSAPQLSCTCCGLLAPSITVLTLGFFAVHASASCAYMQTHYVSICLAVDWGIVSTYHAASQLLGNLGQLLDLFNLGLAFFTLQRLDLAAHHARVVGEPTVVRDPIIVLACQKARVQRAPNGCAVGMLFEERGILLLEPLTMKSVVLWLLGNRADKVIFLGNLDCLLDLLSTPLASSPVVCQVCPGSVSALRATAQPGSLLM